MCHHGYVSRTGILANPVPGATFNYKTAPEEWLAKARRLQEVCGYQKRICGDVDRLA